MKADIRHRGFVVRVEEHKVFVKIEQQTACSACHAKSACLASDKKEQIIEIDDDSGLYAPEEEVIVAAESSKGLTAVTVAFTVPLLLIIVTFMIVESASGNEALGGLAGLSILLPYYLLLYALRDRLRKRFTFTLSKADGTPASEPLPLTTENC